MKVLYFDFHVGASEWYRTLPLSYLAATRSTERDVNFATIEPYDAIVLCRPSSEAHLNIIKLCKDQGKFVIGDYDDDCLHVPPTNPMHGVYEAEKKQLMKCLLLLDEIWVATEATRYAYRLYNKNIHIIPNAWNDTIFPTSPPFKYNKVAMWRGGSSHSADIHEHVEQIVSLINRNPDWKFYWLGAKFEYIQYRVGSNFYNHDGGSTVQFYKMMAEINPCLFFYPLEDTVFNRSKSNCSILESVFSGAAYYGNMSLPEMNVPGTRDWKELWKGMPTAKQLRQQHTQSWKYIQQHLLLSKVNEKRRTRLEAIEQLLTRNI